MDKEWEEVFEIIDRYRGENKDAEGRSMTKEEKIALLVDELEDIRCDNFDADTNEDKTLKEAVRVIKALEQEPKMGHWINGDDKCPCCGKSKFEGLDADIWADWQPKYCPNCGTKMQEVEE